jgi:cytoskeletal protein RodZ
MKSVSIGKENAKEIVNNNFNLMIVSVLAVLIVGLGIAMVILYQRYDETKNALNQIKQTSGTPIDGQQEAQKTLDQLAEHMILPDGKPTVATIVDLEKLKNDNPKFYEKAQVGDRLIIFSEKAILYRYEEDLIVNTAPVQINQNNAEVAGESIKNK